MRIRVFLIIYFKPITRVIRKVQATRDHRVPALSKIIPNGRLQTFPARIATVVMIEKFELLSSHSSDPSF